MTLCWETEGIPMLHEIGSLTVAALAAQNLVGAPSASIEPGTLSAPAAKSISLPVQDPTPNSTAPRDLNRFNPQISIVGDFVARLDDNTGERRRADFREIEFGFAADADPFLRVEAYIGIENEDGETEVKVEEAFGKYNRLSPGLSAKFGKFAAAVGRVQRNHGDQLDYLDYPLVIQDTLGEEGLRQVGASLSYLFPGNRFNELTVEFLDAGDEGPVFNNSSVDKPLWVGHYRTFVDFSTDLSAQIGATYLSGPSLGSEDRGDLYGVDFTAKWQPGGQGRSARFEAEAYWTKPGGGDERSFGWFGRFTYELAPRFFGTVGYDYSEIPGTSDTHKGWLGGMTFKVTEFHHWRLEYQRIESNFESDRNYLNLQFQWVIGSHPAHRY